MIQAIKVPAIGENVTSGIVVAVHIKAGERVAVDDTVIELETDKALVEIPSPFQGRVVEVLAVVGAQIRVGDVIARVETAPAADDAVDRADAPAAPDETPAPALSAEGTGGEETAEPQTVEAREEIHPSAAPAGASRRPPVPAAPSMRRLARELGLDIHDVTGSGPGGRIGAEDIKATARRQLAGAPSPAAGPSAGGGALPDFSRWGEIEIQEIPTVRRLTAQSTAVSWASVPLVTQFDEADITGVTAFIQQYRDKAPQDAAPLTLTAILVRVCAEALKRFPRFNASIDLAANRIVFKRYVHIGIATDTPRGLLVPVIRDADRQSLVDLARAVADLAGRARHKQIRSDELEGGTFTLSNQGGIGGVGFTPLVLWPQAAILGVSRASVKPVYLQDRFEPRTLLPLALSYDHRLIDGADAARFLRWICAGLEQPLNLFLD